MRKQDVFETDGSIKKRITPSGGVTANDPAQFLSKPRRKRHPLLKGLNKNNTIIGELSVGEIHRVIEKMTNINDWGSRSAKTTQPKFGNCKEYTSNYGLRPLRCERLLEWLTPGMDLYYCLYYTAQRRGLTWVSIDVDTHDGQRDGEEHLTSILAELGITKPFSFRTDNGYQSVVRYEGSKHNHEDLNAFKHLVESLGKRNNQDGKYQSTVEVKGLPGIYTLAATDDGARDEIVTHGLLARIPLFKTQKDALLLQEINLTAKKLQDLIKASPEGVPPRKGKTKNNKRTKQTQPHAHTESSARVVRSEGVPPRKGKTTHHESSDARDRMIHAKCEYVRQYKRLPETAEELCDYYAAMGLNNRSGPHHRDRISRAEGILDYSRRNWRVQATSSSAEDIDRDLIASRAAFLSSLADEDRVRELKASRCGVSHLELAAFEVLALVSGVRSRDELMRRMNLLHDDGFLPALISERKMAALFRVLVGLDVVQVKKEYCRPSERGRGEARTFRPGKNGVTYAAWLREAKREAAELRAQIDASVEAMEEADSMPGIATPEGEDTTGEIALCISTDGDDDDRTNSTGRTCFTAIQGQEGRGQVREGHRRSNRSFHSVSGTDGRVMHRHAPGDSRAGLPIPDDSCVDR